VSFRSVAHASRGARLSVQTWPAQDIRLVAVDVESGEPNVFTRDSGVALADAVAASSAFPGIWPSVTIGERRHMDGAIRSPTNADLAAGCDRVLILTPSSADSPRLFGCLEEMLNRQHAFGQLDARSQLLGRGSEWKLIDVSADRRRRQSKQLRRSPGGFPWRGCRNLGPSPRRPQLRHRCQRADQFVSVDNFHLVPQRLRWASPPESTCCGLTPPAWTRPGGGAYSLDAATELEPQAST
jgi:predicted acylesterase/phospholipase RssA